VETFAVPAVFAGGELTARFAYGVFELPGGSQ